MERAAPPIRKCWPHQIDEETMSVVAGDSIELALAWSSRLGAAVGTFNASVIAVNPDGSVELRIADLVRVRPSRPQDGGPTQASEILDEIDAFKSSPLVVPMAVANGAPMYVKNPTNQ